MNYARYSCGIVYDKLLNLVYVGGGHNAENKVEYYDINKNKWINIPNTEMSHSSRPVLWTDNKLLYIASIYSDSMEYIDLRINNKGWNVIYGQNYNTLWHNVFGTRFARNKNCRLCLS